MCHCIETLRVENGVISNIDIHQKRLDKTRAHFGWEKLEIKDVVKNSEKYNGGLYKCSIHYGADIEQILWNAYIPKIHKSFTIIEAPELDYTFKYQDRSVFHNLKSTVDDEIIISQNGLITDTSYANLIFYNGSEWITPSTFLLNGTQRQRLILNEGIRVEKIRIRDLKSFLTFKQINALLKFESSPTYDIEAIRQ